METFFEEFFSTENTCFHSLPEDLKKLILDAYCSYSKQNTHQSNVDTVLYKSFLTRLRNILEKQQYTTLTLSSYLKTILHKHASADEIEELRKENIFPFANEITNFTNQFIDSDKNYSIDKVDRQGNTFLHLAVKNSDLSAVKNLLNQQEYVYTLNQDGYTPFKIAVNKQNKPIVNEFIYNMSLLIDDLSNVFESFEQTVLDSKQFLKSKYRVCNYIYSSLLYLIEKDYLNTIDSSFFYKIKPVFVMLLIEASERSNPKEISQITNYVFSQQNINEQDKHGNTLLHILVQQTEDINVIKILLSTKIDINMQNSKKNTPLHLAVQNGNLSAVKLLLAKDASVYTINKAGSTAFNIALKMQNEFIIHEFVKNIKSLSDAFSSNTLSFKDIILDFPTFFHSNSHICGYIYSSLTYKIENIPTNIDIFRNIDIIFVALLIKTSKIKASKLQNPRGLQLIINYLFSQSNINKQDKDGNTVLLAALNLNNVKLANFLINNGANVNIQNSHGETALHIVSQNNRYKSYNKTTLKVIDVILVEKIVTSLLNKEAFINAVTLQEFGGNTPLHLAVLNYTTNIFEILINNGANLNIYNSDKDTPLLIALNLAKLTSSSCSKLNISTLRELCRLDFVEHLLSKGANANLRDKNNDTPLLLAVQNANQQIAHALVSSLLFHCKNIAIDAKNKDKTPLLLALKLNYLDIAKLLIGKGANVNVCDKNKNTPLLLALNNKYLDIAKLLIEKGANVNICDKGKNIPLLLALNNNYIDIAELLIKNTANISSCIQTLNSILSLHLATKNGHLQIVKFLIDNGTDVNTHNYNHDTPLHFASICGYAQIVEFLINNNANVNAHNRNNDTPLHFASQNGHLQIVELLINNKADVNTPSNNHNTPLHIASQNGHLQIVKFLIDNDADVNAHNNEGLTPLHIASICRYAQIAELLINNKADVNAYNNEGLTPLHIASQNGDLQIAELLINNKADVNAYNNHKNTPLHLATKNGHLQIVECLIDNDADVNAHNYAHETPLILAAKNKQWQIFKLFSDKRDSEFT